MPSVIAPILLSTLLAAALPASAPTKPGIPTLAPVHYFGALLDKATVHEYMQQVLMFSRYSQPKIEPAVDLVPTNVWIDKICGKTNQDCIEASLGFYMPGRPDEVGVVHIRAGMPDRPPSGIIVHELTHWLQNYNGWRFLDNCQDIAAHEIEAYGVEYLRDEWAGVVRPLEIPDVYDQCTASRKVSP